MLQNPFVTNNVILLQIRVLW